MTDSSIGAIMKMLTSTVMASRKGALGCVFFFRMSVSSIQRATGLAPKRRATNSTSQVTRPSAIESDAASAKLA